MPDLVATAEIDVDARADLVWQALTDPEMIKEYLFGSVVHTDWSPGSKIVWKGEFDGKPYEDKGEIVQFEPPRLLVLTHFSPMSGQADEPSNYHTLTYRLEPDGERTHVSLSQDNNASAEEAEHSRSTWDTVLTGLKRVVEQSDDAG
jgi:uncharacterized protein YndB with AHSA1/START domain